MLITQLKSKIMPKKYYSLLGLSALFFSRFKQGQTVEAKMYSLNVPSFPSGSYRADVEGSFDCNPPVKVNYRMEYIERGSSGSTTEYRIQFAVGTSEFVIYGNTGEFKLNISILNSEIPILKSIYKELECDFSNSRFITKSKSIPIIQKIGFKYFETIQTNIESFCEAFDLPNNVVKLSQTLDVDEKTELHFKSDSCFFKLEHYVIIQKEFSRNYTGVIFEIKQHINKKIPSKFKMFFYHSKSHNIGQNDFTVDCIKFETPQSVDEETEKNIIMNIKIWMVLIDAI